MTRDCECTKFGLSEEELDYHGLYGIGEKFDDLRNQLEIQQKKIEFLLREIRRLQVDQTDLVAVVVGIARGNVTKIEPGPDGKIYVHMSEPTVNVDEARSETLYDNHTCLGLLERKN